MRTSSLPAFQGRTWATSPVQEHPVEPTAINRFFSSGKIPDFVPGDTFALVGKRMLVAEMLIDSPISNGALIAENVKKPQACPSPGA
jgi:hypothetical protein